MVQHIEAAANSVGITAFITNSEDKIETQLNRLTGAGDLPIMLVSWDIDTDLTFDSHGFLLNPASKIVALLMTKSQDLTKDDMEQAAVSMGTLFQDFIKALYDILAPLQLNETVAITECTYKLVPKHGMGKHSGVLARWKMRSEINNCQA